MPKEWRKKSIQKFSKFHGNNPELHEGLLGFLLKKKKKKWIFSFAFKKNKTQKTNFNL